MKIKKIITHFQPGLDELAGIFLLKRHGYEIGITRDTPVDFMMNGDFENPPAPEVPHLLYLGCGLESDFNEHYSGDKNTSSCRLVAKFFELSYEVYGNFVDEVTREDRYGSGGVKNHLAQTIKDLYDTGWSALEIYRWASHAFKALTSDKWKPKEFSMDIESCARAIEHLAGRDFRLEWEDVFKTTKKLMRSEYIKAMAYLTHNPQYFKVIDTYLGPMTAYIECTPQINPRIAAAARSKGAQIVLMLCTLNVGDGTSCGVVIQQHHTAGLSFLNVVEELRKHELLYNSRLNGENHDQLKGEGTIAECPVWHGHQAAVGISKCLAIYNRSRTRPLGPATCLTMSYIIDLFLATITVTPKGETVVGMNEFVNPSSMSKCFQTI